MFITSTQQLRNLFVKMSVENNNRLTAEQFVIAAAEMGVYVSLMTATLVSGDYSVLEAREATKEVQLPAFV